MLISSAEVHRVEESIRRMYTHFGNKRTEVFIITSCMIATVYTQNGEVNNETRRITETEPDFEKLHRLNQLSQTICSKNMNAEEIKSSLNTVLKSRPYPTVVEYLSYCITSGAFTIFFCGSIKEVAVSFIIGFFIRLAI